MTALAPPPDQGVREPESAPSQAGGKRIDGTFRAVAFAAGLLVLAILALIAYSTTSKAWPAFTHEGLCVRHEPPLGPEPGPVRGARLHLRDGVDVGDRARARDSGQPRHRALHHRARTPKRWRTAVTYVVDLLAAIPSVVYGFWALAVLVTPIGRLYTHIADTLGTWPVFKQFFGGQAFGTSFMTAGLILAVMITPIITSLTPRDARHRRAGRQERRARHGRDALGDVACRGVPARPQRTHRRGDARPRARDGRDDRGGAA